MAAGSMLLVIGMAALGIDVGTIFADKRRTQSTADLAARLSSLIVHCTGTRPALTDLEPLAAELERLLAKPLR